MAGSIFPSINPSTTSGTQLATLLNDFRDHYSSTGKDTTRDAELLAGGIWVDETNDPIWEFKVYDGTDDITFMSLDTTNNTVSFGSTSASLRIEKITDDSLPAILELFKRRLTGSGQTRAGDVIGEVNFTGYTDLGVDEVQCQIQVVANENVTAGAHGSYIRFLTTQDGTSSLTERMRIFDTGRVGLGATTADARLHVRGNSTTGHIKNELVEDSTVGPQFIKKKSRVAGSGQVLSGDIIGEEVYVSTDQLGGEQTVATVEVVATENTSTTAKGTRYSISTTRNGDTSPTEEINIENGTTTFNSTTSSTSKDTGAVVIEGGLGVEENLYVGGNFQVDGTTTFVNTTDLDVTDRNITINKGGNQAAADDQAGITVEMSDATDASIIYDKDAATKFRIGEVGSEVAVVDELTAQDVSNKAIKTPSQLDVKQDTYANLVTYASTATNGQLVFATDQKVMYQVVDNALTPVGAGGGGLDVFLTETFEVTNATDLTTGKGIFDSGGTLGGALADETASPISSDASLKYTTNATPASSDNDYFYLPAHTLDDKQKGNDVGITFFYTWDGSNDLVEVVIWDDTNNTKLNSSLDTLKTADNPTRFSTAVYIPTSCNAIKVGFQHTGVSEASKVLVVDDIELSTNPFVYKNLVEMTDWVDSGGIIVDGSTTSPTKGTTTIDSMKWRRVGDSMEVVITYHQTSGGSNGSGEYLFSIPSGYTVDSSKISASQGVGDSLGTILGNGRVSNKTDHSATSSDAEIVYAGGNNVKFHVDSAATTTYAFSSANFAFTGVINFSAKFTIPIEGWSSSSEHVVTPAKALNGSAKYTTHGGYGSTNTRIPYMSTETENTIPPSLGVIDYNNTTDGFSFTANERLEVTARFRGYSSAATHQYGITLNSNQLTTSVYSITPTHVKGYDIPASANQIASVDTTFFMEPGDILRPHTDGVSISNATLEIDVKKMDATFLAAVPVQKVSIVNIHATDYTAFIASTVSYKTHSLLSFDYSDGFASLNSNQLTIGAGKYEFIVPIGGNGTNWVDFRLYDTVLTAPHKEFLNASFSGAGSALALTNIHFIVEITEQKTFEFQTKGASGSGSEYIGRPKIIKLR